MIETTNPQIDINELMEQVRREVAKFNAAERVQNGRAAPRRTTLPIIGDLAPPPPLRLSQAFDPRKERLTGAVQKAQRMMKVPRWVPKIFRGLFRNQNGYNHAALDAVAILTKNNLQLSKRVQELMLVAEQHDYWMRQLASRRQAEAIWMRTAAHVIADAAGCNDEVANFSKLLAQQNEALAQLRQSTEVRTEHQAQKDLHNLQTQIDEARDHLRTIQEEANAIRAGDLRTKLANDVTAD